MATAKKSTNIAPETLAAYDKLIAIVPGVERKGDTIPYTSLNGHMFSYILTDGSLALTLPEPTLSAFLKKYKTEHPVSYGVIKKDCALVIPALLKKTSELKPYFIESYNYTASLKPKPTTKAKTKPKVK
jgi:hypothetical protein